MQVCKRWGHRITDMYDSYPNLRQKFCEKCGSATMFQCEHCNTRIRGYYHVEGVIGGGNVKLPLNCHMCGKGYPWRHKLLMKKVILVAVTPAKYVIDSIVGIFKK